MQSHRIDLGNKEPALLQSTAQHVQEYMGWLMNKLKAEASIFSFTTPDKKICAEYISKAADGFYADQKYGHACLQYLTSLEKSFDTTVFLGAKNSFAKLLKCLEIQGVAILREDGQNIELQFVYDRFFNICNNVFNFEKYINDFNLQFECMHDMLKAALILIKKHGIYNHNHLKSFYAFQANCVLSYHNAAKFQILLTDFETRIDILGSKSRGWIRQSFSRFS